MEPLFTSGAHLFTPAGGGGEPTELLTNGSFATASDWTLSAGASIAGGNLVLDIGQASTSATQTLPVEYQDTQQIHPFFVSITIASISQGSLEFHGGTGQGGGAISSAGVHSFYGDRTGTDFVIESSDFCDAVIASVSFILLSGEDLGSELIVNGSFASGAGWTLSDASVSIAGGVLIADNANTQGATNDGVLFESAALYKISYTVSAWVDGTCAPISAPDPDPQNWGGVHAGLSADGTLNAVIRASNADTFGLVFQDSASMNVDNVSLKKYTYTP